MRPPVPAGEWRLWAERLGDWLMRTKNNLTFKTNDRPTANGILLWDTAGYPVVSKDGFFRQIVLADGHGEFYINSDVTFATANTAQALTFTPGPNNHGLSLSGSEITFDEAGHYLVAFSAQIYSTSSSTVEFVFWPRINGVDAPNATKRNALHQNGSTLVVTRAATFTVSAGDTLEAIAAVSNTSGSLKAFAANSIATEPATPSSTLSIIRLHQ